MSITTKAQALAIRLAVGRVQDGDVETILELIEMYEELYAEFNVIRDELWKLKEA